MNATDRQKTLHIMSLSNTCDHYFIIYIAFLHCYHLGLEYPPKAMFPGWCYLEVREASSGRVPWKVCCSLGAWPWRGTFDPSCFLPSLFSSGSEVRLLLCHILQPWHAALSQVQSNQVHQSAAPTTDWILQSHEPKWTSLEAELSQAFVILMERRLTQRCHKAMMKSHDVSAGPIEWLVLL